MTRRVLITGAAGQLGRAVTARLSSSATWEVFAPEEEDLDICSPSRVEAAMRATRPSWVVNCAAWTDVDGAESDPDGAYRVNDLAVGFLADAAQKVGARVVHFGTDYVFDGQAGRPYTEHDATGPLSVYGSSKLAGEERLRSHPVASAILRTSWLYSSRGRNFLRTMLRLGEEASRTRKPVRVVNDQTGTPTDVFTLAIQVEEVLRDDLQGLFHASCEGQATWFEFAREIFEVSGMDIRLEPISTEEFPLPARRPRFSPLENQRLKQVGKNRMVHWKESLRKVVALDTG